MDALVKLLIEQYNMTPEAAARYAQIIHGGKSNPDNLQTEAYTGAVGNRADFIQGSAGADEDHPEAVLTRMGRLRRNALMFTDIATRKAKGEPVAPEHEDYYNRVMAVHKAAVAGRGMKTIDNSNKVRAAEQRMQARPNNEAMQAYLASEQLRDSIPRIEAQRQVIQKTLQTSGRVGSNFGSWGAANGAVEDINYPAQTPEQLDIQRMYGRK